MGYVECDEFDATFYGATSFTGDGLSNWDTSRVTSLESNILRCDLVHGRWIVKLGYVECDEFGGTFSGATSFTGDGVSNWDTSSVTTLKTTFYGATSFTGDGFVKLGYVECDDLSTSTFAGATSFTGDGVSNWDTSSVTIWFGTFYGATSFTGDGLSNWDTSRVTSLKKHSTVRPRSRETDCQIGIRRV